MATTAAHTVIPAAEGVRIIEIIRKALGPKMDVPEAAALDAAAQVVPHYLGLDATAEGDYFEAVRQIATTAKFFQSPEAQRVMLHSLSPRFKDRELGITRPPVGDIIYQNHE